MPPAGFILRVLIAAFLLAAPATPVWPQLPSGQSPSLQTGPMPDTFFYSHIFRHILYLQNAAQTSSIPGPSSPLDSTFYSTRVGANATEIKVLLASAQAWNAEVSPVDAKAHALIDAIHGQTPGGKLAPGQKAPTVPTELLELQSQRDAITLKYVVALRSSFGDDRFEQLDSSLRHATKGSYRGPR